MDQEDPFLFPRSSGAALAQSRTGGTGGNQRTKGLEGEKRGLAVQVKPRPKPHSGGGKALGSVVRAPAEGCLPGPPAQAVEGQQDSRQPAGLPATLPTAT